MIDLGRQKNSDFECSFSIKAKIMSMEVKPKKKIRLQKSMCKRKTLLLKDSGVEAKHIPKGKLFEVLGTKSLWKRFVPARSVLPSKAD